MRYGVLVLHKSTYMNVTCTPGVLSAHNYSQLLPCVCIRPKMGTIMTPASRRLSSQHLFHMPFIEL